MFFELFNKDDVFYRAAVAAVTYRDGAFLVFERKQNPGSYQFSQGGRAKGESIEQSLWRELLEETAIRKDQVSKVIPFPHLISYEYDVTRDLPWVGQTFSWFFLELAAGVEPDLSNARDDEFIGYAWMSKEEILDQLVGFRRDMYVMLFEYFEKL